MKTSQQQAAEFWANAVKVDVKFSPYTIMFQVDDNCPVYMDDYRDWTDYFIESYPSNTTTAFVVDGIVTVGNLRVAAYFNKIYRMTMDTLLWDEHGGFTTA